VVDRSQDERILREVEARIAAEPGLASQSIRVEVEGTMVTLYGSVSGIDAWNCAVRSAQLVEGVGSVVEYLVIERGPRIASCGAAAPR
jgi:osmotically-inducible protein OsmY